MAHNFLFDVNGNGRCSRCAFSVGPGEKAEILCIQEPPQGKYHNYIIASLSKYFFLLAVFSSSCNKFSVIDIRIYYSSANDFRVALSRVEISYCAYYFIRVDIYFRLEFYFSNVKRACFGLILYLLVECFNADNNFMRIEFYFLLRILFDIEFFSCVVCWIGHLVCQFGSAVFSLKCFWSWNPCIVNF